MNKPKVLVFSGYGLNCEEETKFAFELGGAKADIVHINDLIDEYYKLNDYQILAFPGGFSYGDDTGSGNAFAHKINNHLWKQLEEFLKKDNLIIGICNGFQIIVNLGLLPALNYKYGTQTAALLHNNSARYINRWVDVEVRNKSPWLKKIKRLSLPIAHGEGRFHVSTPTLREMEKKKLIALLYTQGEIDTFQDLSINPNGTLKNIAGITDESGKIFGLMPHPERAISFTQLPHWTWLKEQYQRKNKELPTIGPGLQIFQNAVQYFS